jgi:hypothetical protein
MLSQTVTFEPSKLSHYANVTRLAAVFKFTGFNRSFTDQFESIPILTPALMRGGSPGQKERKCVMNWPQ